MAYWKDNVDKILIANEQPLLIGKGNVSKEQMETFANAIYEDFNARRKAQDAIDADAEDMQELFELEQENQSKYSYVENIKAHAFVPNKYLHNYFDFLFSFYDRNLFRQLTEEIDEDIDDLIGFVSESLSRNPEAPESSISL